MLSGTGIGCFHSRIARHTETKRAAGPGVVLDLEHRTELCARDAMRRCGLDGELHECGGAVLEVQPDDRRTARERADDFGIDRASVLRVHAREDLVERRGGNLREKRQGEHLVVSAGIGPEQPGDVVARR